MELALYAGQEALAVLALLVSCALAARAMFLPRRHIYNSGSAAVSRLDGRP
ncbi:MAG TPA: hypothetical protein VEW70_10455 [Burkholderiales bacterium]|nr:hypothetical protein [Burkholderiales bacterium]